uniref:Secreted protein n=1 Tax=Panagrellus redivivus TaxID=6233 RepID=A0A7E4VVL7_PANRE
MRFLLIVGLACLLAVYIHALPNPPHGGPLASPPAAGYPPNIYDKSPIEPKPQVNGEVHAPKGGAISNAIARAIEKKKEKARQEAEARKKEAERVRNQGNGGTPVAPPSA